jgi:hypothetical protein
MLTDRLERPSPPSPLQFLLVLTLPPPFPRRFAAVRMNAELLRPSPFLELHIIAAVPPSAQPAVSPKEAHIWPWDSISRPGCQGLG